MNLEIYNFKRLRKGVKVIKYYLELLIYISITNRILFRVPPKAYRFYDKVILCFSNVYISVFA